MKKVSYLLVLFMLFLNSVSADDLSPQQDTSFKNIYKQGIYDSLITLEDYISQDLIIKRIKDFDNKIIVAIPTKNLPTNDIIYYSVITKKKFFNPITAYDLKSKKGYLVFNAYSREADADFALKQLNSIHINAYKIYNGKWVSYPVVVKNIINILKIKNLKNMPTKVIIEKIYIYKKEKPKIKYISIPTKKRTIKHNTSSLTKTSQNNKLKRLITLITHIKYEGQPFITKDGKIGFFYKNKFYTLGDKINGFTITETKKSYYYFNGRKYMKLIFRFDNYNNYHLIFRIPLKKPERIVPPKKPIKKPKKEIKVPCNNCNPERNFFKNKTTETQVTNTNNNTSSKKESITNNVTNNFYTCDFSNVQALNDPQNFEKLILRINTPYGDFNKFNLIKISDNGKYVIFQASGKPKYAIPKKIWDIICHK